MGTGLRRLVERLRREVEEGDRRTAYPSGRRELIGFEGQKKKVAKRKSKFTGASLKRVLMPPKVGL